MKKTFVIILCLAALSGGGTANAQPAPFAENTSVKSHNGNPWGLVYRGAITANEPGKVNIRPIVYDLGGYEYYLQSHAHPNSTFRYTKSSLVELMAFDASADMYLIDRPLLMIAGSQADTFYMTEQCFSRATGIADKELFLIPGATHIRTYYVPEYVDAAVKKLTEFFGSKM